MLLIRGDVADWKIIDTLPGEGGMDGMRVLRDGGAHADLAPLEPPRAPTVSTHRAIGKWTHPRGVEGLGTAQHPDKTLIGHLERGFDFLGVPFTACGELSPSARSRARPTEKTAQLDAQSASGGIYRTGSAPSGASSVNAPPDPAPRPELAPSPRYPFPRSHGLLDRIIRLKS